METIIIAKDFTDAPGARYRDDGDKSGEEFYEEILKGKYTKAIKEGVKLLIDFDGTFGYPTSFLSEAFGRLYKDFGKNDIWKHIEIKSDEDNSLEDLIKELLKDYE